MRILLISFLLFALNADVYTQATYSKDVAKLIYSKCSSCHRSGEIGPMALTNYEEVQAWGATIKYVINEGIMPPWQPDPTYSKFLGENYLTEDEISTITQWIDDGMPRGNQADEPAFPDFPEGSVLGEPDLVLEMEEEWLHEGNNRDDYRYFVLPSGLLEDKVVKAVEFRPGNSKIVHHALIFEDTTGDAAANDADTPEYGFDGFGGFQDGGADNILNQKQYPGYVPGQKPLLYPDGIGETLHAGADVVVQVHYAPWPVDEVDRSTINFFFMDEEEEEFEREVQGHIMVPLFNVINDVFVIPPNTVREFHGRYEVPRDVSLVSISPHMHLLGKHWEVWLEKPDGEIVNLIHVPDWDFNWQGTYNFDRFIVAPEGSIVHAVASYDNTLDNPNNPSNPTQFVSWGEGTEDEMYYLPIGFVDYEDGDEDIVFEDPTISSNGPDLNKDISYIYPITPNPVDDFAVAGFRLKNGQALNIEIFNAAGQRVRSLRQGEFFNIGDHFINFSTKNLDAGLYFIQMTGENLLITQKFVKQ